MDYPVTARAQTEHALEAAAQALKRQLGTSRRALQAVRQAQAALIGIETESQETQNGRNENEAAYR